MAYARLFGGELRGRIFQVIYLIDPDDNIVCHSCPAAFQCREARIAADGDSDDYEKRIYKRGQSSSPGTVGANTVRGKKVWKPYVEMTPTAELKEATAEFDQEIDESRLKPLQRSEKKNGACGTLSNVVAADQRSAKRLQSHSS